MREPAEEAAERFPSFDTIQPSQAALDGVHDAERTLFSVPWTDAAPADLPRNLATYHWSLLNRVDARNWTVAFAVRLERNSFVRPDWTISVRGAEPALDQLGVAAR